MGVRLRDWSCSMTFIRCVGLGYRPPSVVQTDGGRFVSLSIAMPIFPLKGRSRQPLLGKDRVGLLYDYPQATGTHPTRQPHHLSPRWGKA